MSLQQTVPYIDINEFKRVAGIDDLEDEEAAQDALSEAAGLIDTYCGRSFHLVTETRLFDAPPSDWLLVPNLANISGLSLFSAPLTAGDYQIFAPRDPDHDSYRLVRLSSGRPARWDQDPVTYLPLGLPYEAVSITGVWAFRAFFNTNTAQWEERVPDKIGRANVLLAISLLQLRSTQYVRNTGGLGIGTRPSPAAIYSQEARDILNSYVLRGVDMRVGSPYGDP